jgi:hypothetical protein
VEARKRECEAKGNQSCRSRVIRLGNGAGLWHKRKMEEDAGMPSKVRLTRENLQVQVIHYTQLKERRPHMERIIRETGLDQFAVRWVEAWDREEIEADGKYLRGEWGDSTKIAAGSVSLILKHVEAWRKSASEPDKWHLILEDDLLVPKWRGSSWIAELETTLAELPSDKWDMLFIGAGCGLHVPWWRRIGRGDRRVFWRGWRKGIVWGGGGCSRCTEAYLIHPAFASRLLASKHVIPPFDRPIDWLLNRVGPELKVRSFWAEPPLVTQGAFVSWMKDKNLHPQD